MQRAKVRQLLLCASTKEQHEFAALKLASLAQTAAPLGHAAHGRAARTGANHHNVGLRVVGHQEAAAKRTNHLDGVAHFHIAQIVGTHAMNGFAFVIFDHPLHRQRHIVVAGALAVAWAGNGVLASMVRLA